MGTKSNWRNRLFRTEARMTPEESRKHEQPFFFVSAALLLVLALLCLVFRNTLGNMTEVAVAAVVLDSVCLAILGLMWRRRKK